MNKIINHFLALLLLSGCSQLYLQPENSISNESIVGIIPLPGTLRNWTGYFITGQSSIGIDRFDPEMTTYLSKLLQWRKSVTPQAFSCQIKLGTIIFQLGEHKELGVRRISASISWINQRWFLFWARHHGISGIQRARKSILGLHPPSKVESGYRQTPPPEY